MAEEKDIALIEQYLEGMLSAEDRAQTEERLSSDQDFQQLFEDIKLLRQGLEKASGRILLKRMDSLEAGLSNPLEEKETKTVFWTFGRLAAAFIGVVLVASLSWMLLKDNAATDPQALYEAYYEPYPTTLVTITRGETDTTLLARTIEAYESQAYQEASALFEQLMKVDERDFVRLYAAQVYMNLDEGEQATKLMESLISKNSELKIQATWFQALNYIKLEKYDRSIALLEILAGTQSTYRKKSQELLEKLK